jgi:hypothetical protein
MRLNLNNILSICVVLNIYEINTFAEARRPGRHTVFDVLNIPMQHLVLNLEPKHII